MQGIHTYTYAAPLHKYFVTMSLHHFPSYACKNLTYLIIISFLSFHLHYPLQDKCRLIQHPTEYTIYKRKAQKASNQKALEKMVFLILSPNIPSLKGADGQRH